MMFHIKTMVLKVVLVTGLVLALTDCTNAAIVLSFQPTSPTTTVTGGAGITVDLVLSETTTNNISLFGVAGASFQVTRVGSGTLATPLGNANFDLIANPITGSDPTFRVNQTSILGVGQGASQVVIGSFLINPTSDGAGSLSVSAFGSADDIVVYTDNVGGFQNLTSTIFNGVANFNYSITAVPEPSSAALVFVAGLTVLKTRRRRQ